MMEYTANATVRDAIARAHAERGQALRAAVAWLLAPRREKAAKVIRPKVSRWA